MGSVGPPLELQSFEDGTPMETIMERLYLDGAVLIRHVVSESAIADINAELKPYFDAPFNSGLEVFAKETKTVCGLAGKSPAAVKAILQAPTVRAARNAVLEQTSASWWGDMRNVCVSPPLLSSFFTVRVGPGSARQGLHRDDQDHHATHTNKDPRETTKMGCFVATSKTTRANGATEVVLRSHTWDDERKPDPADVVYGEMNPGDALLVLGNCYHGAGGNTTEDEFRNVIVSLFCKGTCRQEENQFLAVDIETARKMDYEVQDLIGWKASAPFCGWHDLSNPSDLIRDKEMRTKDLF